MSPNPLKRLRDALAASPQSPDAAVDNTAPGSAAAESATPQRATPERATLDALDAGAGTASAAPATQHVAARDARSAGDAKAPVRRITLISKPGCHLCDDARAVIERVAAETGAQVEEINMLDDPALVERYAEQIPVTLVDGRQHDYWRVDEKRLRTALAAQA